MTPKILGSQLVLRRLCLPGLIFPEHRSNQTHRDPRRSSPAIPRARRRTTGQGRTWTAGRFSAACAGSGLALHGLQRITCHISLGTCGKYRNSSFGFCKYRARGTHTLICTVSGSLHTQSHCDRDQCPGETLRSAFTEAGASPAQESEAARARRPLRTGRPAPAHHPRPWDTLAWLRHPGASVSARTAWVWKESRGSRGVPRVSRTETA